MNLSELTAVSPLDGRYRSSTAALANYCSEYALIRYRVRVEVEYFLALARLPLPELRELPADAEQKLRSLCEDFTPEDAARVKEIEKSTNHDVKAVELFLGERFEALGLGRYRSFVHFGLTSQDVNDTSIPMMLRDSLQVVVGPLLEDGVLATLRSAASEWKDVVMLARTHGQPATPTRLGKEMMVFVERLETELTSLQGIRYAGKLGGATGGMNAHWFAYPQVDWPAFASEFLETRLSLHRPRYTTQIGHHENLSLVFDNLNRICGVLLDLCQDMWLYIMQGYFRQAIRECEVGSSAMPHKVNPIEFENAEGNLSVASASLTHLARRLAVSRLQRDLTDYTVKRNIGVPLAHLVLACRNIKKGFGKLQVDHERIQGDLESSWGVVAEALQTLLRRTGDAGAYDKLKLLTRGQEVSEASIRAFIAELGLDADTTERLSRVSPFNYLGPQQQ
jgi:adenylosuccinate lyase